MEQGFEVVNLNASGVIPTPNIRINGNWYVGNKDTGIAARGEKGDQGIQGIRGEKGDQGEKGADADPAELERISGEINALKKSLGTYHETTTTHTSAVLKNYSVVKKLILSSSTGLVDGQIKIILAGTSLPANSNLISINARPLVTRDNIPCELRNTFSGAMSVGYMKIDSDGVVSNTTEITGFNEIELQISYFATN